jgi:phosphopantothenoylcysteine decarboxylase/phosphopantothenate--cysteine ligase
MVSDSTDTLDTSSHAPGRVALGVCGGIAAYKAAEILRGLQRAGCRVRVAMTEHATKMIAPLTFRALSGEQVIVDDYAPDNPDPIAHITFSQTVDLFLIAPATANIIAKFAHGIADDFLTSTLSGFDRSRSHRSRHEHNDVAASGHRAQSPTTRADGVRIVEPDAGEMACGTIGPGRLSDPERIVAAALQMLAERDAHSVGAAPKTESNSHRANAHNERDLAGERILITAGATREEIDPVRFLSNRSSGRMGFALAEAARQRGAEVTIVAGATSVNKPAQVRVLHALSADEMHAAVLAEIAHSTVFIGAAAVSDYRPAARSAQKIKKSGATLTLMLEPTPDILAAVAAHRHAGLLVIGFAAESEKVAAHAREKLVRKQLDAIIANDITRDGAGFDTDTNIITLLARDRDAPVELPLMSKLEAAHCILDEVVRLRHATEAQAAR